MTGAVVFAGCEAATAGAGSIGCGALSGAAANAVSYGITAAQTGKFSWSGLAGTTLNGAVQGAAGGALGDLASTAGEMLTTDASAAADSTAATAEDTASGASCTFGGQSFAAATGVLLASGRTEPISKLRTGQKVLAADTRTGKNQAETITAVLVHHDKNLYDLKVREHGHVTVIHTTSNHPFWVPYLDQFIPANHLKKGEHLKTPDGTLATADGGTTPKDHVGWMWDLTVPGNNDHDFYVLPADGDSSTYYRVDRDGVTPILVHNCGVDPSPGPAPEGSTLEEYGKANVGETNATTPDFVTEFTSAAGKRYYGRTELPGEGPVDLEPGSLVDDALRTDKISCSEVCAALEAQKAEGPMGAYGGTFRTLQLRSLESQAKGFESGVPVDPCPDSCQTMIRNLGGTWTK